MCRTFLFAFLRLNTKKKPPVHVCYSKFFMHSAGAALPWSDYDCVGLCQEP